MKRFLILSLSLHISLTLFAQKEAPPFSIYISDNHNIQNEAYNYFITGDSLIITGISDYGKSTVEYLKRTLSEKEKKTLNAFMLTFQLDPLKELYFKGYDNLDYISPEHYPRVFDLELNNLNKAKKIRINNTYVARLAELFHVINPLLPEEVKIKYEEKDLIKGE